MNRRDPGFDVWMVVADMFVGFLCVFLLLTWVPMLPHVDEIPSLRDLLAALERENQALRQQLTGLEGETSLLRNRLVALEEENYLLRNRLAIFEKENSLLKKGRAKDYCLKGNNTLIEVVARNGTFEVVILLQDDDMEDLPHRPNVPFQKGQVLKEEREIERLRETALQFERSTDCRFDYRLKFLTDTNYRLARERFERHFYPSGIRRIAQ